MTGISRNLKQVLSELPENVRLVAVSKNHQAEAISEAYRAGQRVFGENRVQELLAKRLLLPEDIEWHLIGHLQTNKVKSIVPFVSMIHSIDSLRLLEEVSAESIKVSRVVDCLLQVHIAEEETKFGFDPEEVRAIFSSQIPSRLPGVRICGLMGMATFTDDLAQIESEFHHIHLLFKEIKEHFGSDHPYFKELSIGMSGDYRLAIKHGSTLIRIGTSIFGLR